MKHLLLICMLSAPMTSLAQTERTPQLPDWVLVLAQLGDIYQQWCEEGGGTYARDEDHQLAPGGQWKCYDRERPERG